MLDAEGGTHDDKVQHVDAIKVQAAGDQFPELQPERHLWLALPAPLTLVERRLLGETVHVVGGIPDVINNM